MNRNGQLIAKSEQYAQQLEDLLKAFVGYLDNPDVLKAFMKRDVSGHLHEIRAVSGTEALKRYLLKKAAEDPFAFGESLHLIKFQMRKGMAGGTNADNYRHATAKGVGRVNPNVKAAEPGRNLPMEEPPKGETKAQKALRRRASLIAAKSQCARHCQKVGRPNCTYCNGIGYFQRSRHFDHMGEGSNFNLDIE